MVSAPRSGSVAARAQQLACHRQNFSKSASGAERPGSSLRRGRQMVAYLPEGDTRRAWRSSPLLVRAQRLHRIDAKRAARRRNRGDASHAEQRDRDGRVGRRVGALDEVEYRIMTAASAGGAAIPNSRPLPTSAKAPPATVQTMAPGLAPSATRTPNHACAASRHRPAPEQADRGQQQPEHRQRASAETS